MRHVREQTRKVGTSSLSMRRDYSGGRHLGDGNARHLSISILVELACGCG
jgi:hypothetical protein